MTFRQIARDISYASSAGSRASRVLIRTLENVTGRISLIRRARGYEDEVAAGGDFWEVICNRYGITMDIRSGSLDAIPRTGPVIVVANHPYGILDGLMMGRMLSARRGGDFRILAHRVFRKSPDLEKVILPISFDDTKEAARQNLETRAEALRYLGQGGAIGVFPGGTVSTSARVFDPPLDPTWRNFTAKMITRSNATVVPVFFEGANSGLFQIASRVHYTLRLGMLIREFKTRVNQPVRIHVGQPVLQERLAEFRADPTAMMDFLRRVTYELSPDPVETGRIGHEFEARYRMRRQESSHGGGHIRQRARRADRP
ncbi:lysophospholipid acyltransferase family protein [Ponticoccus sp. SC2-23]|uniref:lysophospholipid acyltransferase family protein n=1 Tax=Alexandriicola marinus TaxID=2081710 RepID=UPI000FD8A479|nr:lysophospholipid acyltransferase family protein [Alexandriicola marinus]MBM1219255.1 lysophospholipid acyltransferase family protein [Ponticoccus sp. SC6-9]MBM1223673.1 lysophospholipid acyltransferase family protein [Ponticoccus sp. SC6-15]MBM1229068.1 lysophospholipid acyltransferase family protein [Ponticoccus sp. SC6-38]MBM1232639.1 lysophospholipid acyltransferase family protein [Ponticoccus sp. SC6-45]MBM1237411.1 lysophospholipid acyltransferase family protein [Ponticoccus sp. SC6-49